MANTSQKLIDSTRRVVYSFTGDAAEVRTLKINPGTLAFSMNANNRILGAGTDRKSQYRLALKKVIYSINGGPSDGFLQISTDGDASPNTMLNLSGSGVMAFAEGGDDFTLAFPVAANSTGNIYFSTSTFFGNCSYSVIMDFRKNPADFDQGQTADPTAFNR